MKRLLILVLLTTACGDDEEPTAAERFCARADACPQTVVLTSQAECAAEFQRLANETPNGQACLECLADLPCAGIDAIRTRQRTECDLCRACCG